MLEDRVALVTGSSYGIGRAVALTLGEHGARVCVNSWQDEERAEAVADALQQQGREAFQVQADVSDKAAVQAMVESVLARWGRIDILVNNAGISGAGAPFLDVTEEVWDRMIDVNLKGVFLCCQAALPAMMEAGYGRIVNIASTAGVSSLIRSNAHYAAAKGGVVALTKRLARDFGPHSITANCLAPGLILDTGFNERMSDELVASYVDQIPVGRPGKTDDAAAMALFLASEDAGYISGQIICLDGGATC